MAGILNYILGSALETEIVNQNFNTTNVNDENNQIDLQNDSNRNAQNVHNFMQPSAKTVINDCSNTTNIEKNITDQSNNWNITINKSTNENPRIEKELKEPIIFDVYQPVKWFTGRQKELNDIHSKLQTALTESTIVRAVAIVGLGGMGKTQIAKEYAKQYENEYRHLIWINAENRENLVGSFKSLYGKINIGHDDIEKSIKFYVEQIYNHIGLNDRTLLIFDNVEKYKDIDDFMPKIGPRPHCIFTIITSRYRDWDIDELGDFEIVKLEGFSEDEAVQYVEKRLESQTENKDDILKLVKELQAFPLGLKHAVGYINAENKNWKMYKRNIFTIMDYLSMYKNQPKSILDNIDDTDVYGKTIYRTWDITMDKIRNYPNYGLLADDILCILAYFDPVINLELLSMYYVGVFETVSKQQIEKALRCLEMYSMLDIDENLCFYTYVCVHRLVQHVLKTILRNNKKEEMILTKALRIIARADEEDYHNIEMHATSIWSIGITYESLMNDYYPTAFYGFDRKSPLHLFAEYQNDALERIVKLKNIDINSTDIFHTTPLNTAIKNGYLRGIECILKNGGTLNYGVKNVNFPTTFIMNFDEILCELANVSVSDSEHQYYLTHKNAIVQPINLNCRSSCLTMDTSTLNEDAYLLIDNLFNDPLETWETLKKHNQYRNELSIFKNEIKKIDFNNHAIDLQLKIRMQKENLNLNKTNMLHLATESDQLNLVKYFIKLGENPMDFDDFGETVLHMATDCNHINIVKYLIEDLKIDVNIKNSSGESSIHLVDSVDENNLELAKYLISQGANINAEDGLGLTPIFNLVNLECDMETIGYLLDLGAKTRCSSNSILGKLNVTLSQFAILCGNVEAFEVLTKNEQPDKTKYLFGWRFSDLFCNKIERIFDNVGELISSNHFAKSIRIKSLCISKNFLTRVWTYDKKEYEREQMYEVLKIVENSTYIIDETFIKKLLIYVKNNKNISHIFQQRNTHVGSNVHFKLTVDSEFDIESVPNFENDLEDQVTYFEFLSGISYAFFSRSVFDKTDESFDFSNISIKLNYRTSRPVSNFVGRQDTLCKLHEYIQRDRIVVIAGKAGVGKTEVAKKYVQQFENSYERILWMDASSRCKLLGIFEKLHRKNNLKSKRYLTQLIKNTHKHFDSCKTLYIFDNADSDQTIEDFLPMNESHVLINSRNYQNWADFSRIKLEDFAEKEAEDYARKRTQGLETDEQIKMLIKTLGFHPLTLKQAIGYINETRKSNCEFGIQSYIELFNNYVGKDITNASYDEVCIKTWMIIFNEVRNHLKDAEHFTTLFFFSSLDRKYILKDHQENFNLIKRYTSTKAYIEITKLYLIEVNQEVSILKKILSFLKNYRNKFDLNIVILTLDIWNRIISYRIPIEDYYVYLAISSFIINRKQEQLEKTLNLINKEIFNYFFVTSFLLNVEYNFLAGIDVIVKFSANINIVKLEFELYERIYFKYGSLLHIAAANGNKEIVVYLKNKLGHAANVKNKEGRTPAMLAAYFGHTEVVKVLTKCRQLHLTAMLYAIINDKDDEHEFVSVLERFKNENPDISNLDFIFNVCIVNEIQIEDAKSIMTLPLTDRYRNKFPRRCYTLLHSASFGGHLDAVKLLVKKKYDVLETDYNGNSALHYAAMNGHIVIVKYLLKKRRVKPDVKNIMGNTPLHLASLFGHCEMVKLLIKSGADVNAVDNIGATSEFYATFGDNPDLVQLLVDVKGRSSTSIFKLVSNAIKSKNNKNSPVLLLQDLGITPLHISVIFDNLEIAKLFLNTHIASCLRDKAIGFLFKFNDIFEGKEVLQFLIDNNIITDSPRSNMEKFKLNPEQASMFLSVKLHLLNIFNLLKRRNNKSERYFSSLAKIEKFVRKIL